MARVDAESVALARARAVVRLGGVGGAGPEARVAARRAGRVAGSLRTVEPALLHALARAGGRDALTSRVAAVLHGHDVARSVTAEARAEVAGIMDDATRRLAMRLRAHARPPEAGLLGPRHARTREAVRAALGGLLADGACDAVVRRALDAVLAEGC